MKKLLSLVCVAALSIAFVGCEAEKAATGVDAATSTATEAAEETAEAAEGAVEAAENAAEAAEAAPGN